MIAEIGDTIELTSNTMKLGEKFPAGSKFVDGVGTEGVDSFVLRDRIHLSEDGIIVVVVGLEEYSYNVSSVEVINKGISLTDAMISEVKANLANSLKKADLKSVSNQDELNQIVRRSIKKYIFNSTKKNPMILPVVMVV